MKTSGQKFNELNGLNRVKEFRTGFLNRRLWLLLATTLGVGGWNLEFFRCAAQTPVITSQPTNQTVAVGGPAYFTVTVSSPTFVTYQWRFNNGNISGATASSYVIAHVQPSNAGEYSVVASNADGSVTSVDALLTVVSWPVIVTQPQSQSVTQGSTINLSVSASGQNPLSYQWHFNNGELDGATNPNLTISNVQAWQAGAYSVEVSNAYGVTYSSNALVSVAVLPGQIVGWGNNDGGQATVPWGLGNLQMLAAGGSHSVVLKTDGTLVAWGSNSYGQASVPLEVTNVAAVSAGDQHNLVLYRNGFLFAWGDNTWGQMSLPTDPGNVVAVAAGGFHNLFLRSDGTAVGSGYDAYGQAFVPPLLSNLVAVAGGWNHSLALRNDGSVVAWGDNSYGQTNPPPDLTNAVAIAAGIEHCLALTSAGTVVAWGANYAGQSQVPPGLTNVVAIAAGKTHSVAMRRNGTLVAWGDNGFGQTNLPAGLTNAAAISSRGDHTLALAGNGAVVITVQPFNQHVNPGDDATFRVMAAGRGALTYQWRWNGSNIVAATKSSYTRTNVQVSDAGNYSVIVNNSFGPVVSSNALLSLEVPGGALQFTSNTYSIPEDASSVTLFVSRIGGSFGPASVQFSTTNGTASAGSDYYAASGPLTWADGEMGSKPIEIVLLDDIIYEGNEFFTVNLSDPTGAVLGAPNSAKINLIENDPAPPPRLSGPIMLTNGFKFQLIGAPGTYVIQASSDLLSWLSLSTNTTPSGSLTFVDPNAGSIGRRYYRARVE